MTYMYNRFHSVKTPLETLIELHNNNNTITLGKKENSSIDK